MIGFGIGVALGKAGRAQAAPEPEPLTITPARAQAGNAGIVTVAVAESQEGLEEPAVPASGMLNASIAPNGSFVLTLGTGEYLVNADYEGNLNSWNGFAELSELLSSIGWTYGFDGRIIAPGPNETISTSSVNGGWAEITEYTGGSNAVSQPSIQTLTLSIAPTSGDLTFNGATPIQLPIQPAAIEAAILESLGETVTATANGLVFTVTFQANGPKALLVVTPGTMVSSALLRNEIQTITFSRDLVAGDVSWEISLGEETTAPIAWNANAAAIDNALEALAGVGTGNVQVQFADRVVTLEFVGSLAATPMALVSAALTA